MTRPCAWCGQEPARMYPAGPLCARHQPKPPPVPPPGTTLAEMRARREAALAAAAADQHAEIFRRQHERNRTR